MNRDYVYNGLLKRGYQPHHASGIVRNIEDESSFNPRAIGDNGAAGGLAQWNGPRFQALKSFAGERGKPWDDADLQLDFLDHELKGPESAAAKRLLAATNEAEAAVAFNTHYERPARENLERRNAKYLGTPYTPSNPTMDQSNAGAMSFLPNESNPAQPPDMLGMLDKLYPEEPKDEPSALGRWTDKNMPWLTDDRSEMLLAIGTGLLSGDDWASGIGAAGENIMGVNQGRKDREKETQDGRRDIALEAIRAQRDQEFALERGASGSKGYSRMVNNIEMPDGSIISGATWNPDGSIVDPNGNVIDMNGAKILNNSDAYGSKGQPSWSDVSKSQTELESMHSSLQAIDRVKSYLDEDPVQGVGMLAQTTDAMVRTLIGRGLTQEQIDKAVVDGDLQSLIGQTRETVVGPGVMTEPDAVRVLLALGGDYQSILKNPDALRARLNVVQENQSRLYGTKFDQYEFTRSSYPQLSIQPLTRYAPPERATKSSNPVDQSYQPEKPQGPNDPESLEDEIEDYLRKHGI